VRYKYSSLVLPDQRIVDYNSPIKSKISLVSKYYASFYKKAGQGVLSWCGIMAVASSEMHMHRDPKTSTTTWIIIFIPPRLIPIC